MAAFEDYVLVWLRGKDPLAHRVTSVDAGGSDWAGSTEDGFYDRFEVDIRYVRVNGEATWRTVNGADLESLWKHVVAGVPS